MTKYLKAVSKVDWPVNLVFVSAVRDTISTSKVKKILGTSSPLSSEPAFAETGSAMHSVFVPAADLSVLGLGDFVWDKDQGVKEYPGHKCKNEDGRVDPAEPDINYHFRVYGPNGEGVLQDPTYGYFVVGTSHIDYRESCPEGSTAPFVNNATGWGTAGFSGESELAEAFIANEFEKRGYWVERDKIYLVNSIHAGHSQSNGMATVIHLG